jgi:hypothetical protein
LSKLSFVSSKGSASLFGDLVAGVNIFSVMVSSASKKSRSSSSESWKSGYINRFSRLTFYC